MQVNESEIIFTDAKFTNCYNTAGTIIKYYHLNQFDKEQPYQLEKWLTRQKFHIEEAHVITHAKTMAM